MESQQPAIEAVLFDYGQVLSGPPNPAAWAEMRSISGLGEDALHCGYWLHRHPYDRGTHTGSAYWQLVGETHGSTFTAGQVDALIAADITLWTDLNLPMLAWAQSLHTAGIRTGILSNLGDSMASGILAKFDWLRHFDHCTWSHTLHLTKPEPEIYRRAAEGLQTSPAKILFIDDRADNVEGALVAGMQAIQYTGHPAFLAEMEAKGLTYLLHPELQPVSATS